MAYSKQNHIFIWRIILRLDQMVTTSTFLTLSISYVIHNIAYFKLNAVLCRLKIGFFIRMFVF